MYIDPIADLLTKIRNGIKAKSNEIEVPTSSLKTAILHVLLNEGYIKQFELYENKNKTKFRTKIKLKYKEPLDKTNTTQKVSSITGLKQISKPGLRVYASVDKLPYVLNGLGIAIISTSEGVMTDKKARAAKIGGEVIAYVW